MSKKLSIKVCMGPAGMVAGGAEVLEAFKSALDERNIKADFHEGCSAHKVGCRGLCAKDVLVEIDIDGNKTPYQLVKADMVERIVEEHIVGGVPVKKWTGDADYYAFFRKQVRVLLSDCGEIDPEDINAYIAVGGYEATRKVLTSMTPEEVIQVMEDSGLRGRGGAGFPTGYKWKQCRKDRNEPKYIICNADEGDPGAFMDRAVIEGNPHALIEGMLIGAFSIGSNSGYVYIRAEYPLAVERLKEAIAQAKAAGYLGKNILGTGFDFDIKINLGAGAFVCGESTALMKSIEGRRGMPRPTPPRSVNKGLWAKPTVLNNVETFANVPYIIRHGAEWFASYGTEKSKGTKVFALTGKIKNPGLIEVPMGITLKEIIYDIGGGIENNKALKAVQTGGPSGGCIPANMMDISVDFESLAKVGSIVGSGGMIVLDEDDCMVNMAKYFLHFTQEESCGKCVPCRIGTKRLYEILVRITKGQGREGDIELLKKLSDDVLDASLCGLGQSAPNPILSTIQYFRDEYETHIKHKKCPAKVCRDLVTYKVIEDACKGCGACLRACPAKAITGEKKKPHLLNQALCIKCGSCFDVCKFKAIGRD
ncbi:MAG: NADH-quinone oxidoreductase subunit NuoF [Nitrospirae bacterium]|nr:NADH-quinone oxidoreductase subunit NuoF [Nitrospirota bacterium]